MTEDPDGSPRQRLAKAQRLAVLLQAVGYALWQCAEVEDALAYYLVARLRMEPSDAIDTAAGALTSARKRTFGQLLGDLRAGGVLPEELDAMLSPVVDERNWLVHRAKRENRGATNMDDATFGGLMARVERLAADALTAQQAIERAVTGLRLRQGVRAAELQAEAARLARQWGYELEA